MKYVKIKKLVAFIITVLMFSILPTLVNGQKQCTNGNCPKGRTCINGYCVKITGCNCSVRPIPFECGAVCGFLANQAVAAKTTLATIYYSDSQSATISFSLDKPGKISAKIFDMTGQLVERLADKIFEGGDHELKWDATGANAGIYMVQFNAGAYSEMKKISVLK